MRDWLQAFGSTDGFMPHGMCYLWEPSLLWTHVLADGLTWLAYWAIPPALVLLAVRLRREAGDGTGYLERFQHYQWVFWAFGLFIVACGTTHLMAIVTVWRPEYWWSGGVKVVTAVTSMATAIALPPMIPKVVRLVGDARASEARRGALEAANRELEDLNARLVESERARTDFFANVSHELRTPLTLILGPADELSEASGLSDRDRRSVRLIQRNAQTLLDRVEDLLDVSRMEWTRPTPQTRSVDLVALAADAVDEFRQAAARRGVALELAAPEALPVEVDPDMVERILVNLLSNAMKFTPAEGRIRCHLTEIEDGARSKEGAERGEEAEHAPREIRIAVSDTGPGVDPAQRQVVFERFRRLSDRTANAQPGSGLGLAIVRELTTALGGTASVSETEGGGATFSVTFPVEFPSALGSDVSPVAPVPPGRARERDSAPPLIRIGPEALAEPSDASGTILVVDDNEDLCLHLASVLGDTYRIYAALDGARGLIRAEELHPDLIVTDMMMPLMGGEALIDALQSRAHLRDVPVVVLTARTDRDLPARLIRTGARDFLTKPVRADELRARIDSLLDTAMTRKILERDTHRSHQALHELAGELSEKRTTLEEALEQQRLLLRELHHRVKGNLQTVASLLSLQVRRSLDPSVNAALTDVRGRIAAMSLVHEALYAEGSPLALRLGEYLERLVHMTVQSHARNPGQVRTSVRCDPVEIGIDQAIPLALITYELLTNALKHSVSEGGTVTVDFSVEEVGPNERFATLQVRDDGTGGGDLEHVPGMGLTLVRDLGRQLGGTLRASRVEGGSLVELRLPIPDPAEAAAEGSV